MDVTVLDLNDNPPVFVNKPYYAVVSRQAEQNSRVIRVTAVDADAGVNADIYYQLVNIRFWCLSKPKIMYRFRFFVAQQLYMSSCLCCLLYTSPSPRDS